jgi:hypothetical protein
MIEAKKGRGEEAGSRGVGECELGLFCTGAMWRGLGRFGVLNDSA